MGNCCKAYFIVNGPAEALSNNDHGAYVCSGERVAFNGEVKSWDCVGAEAKFCTEKHCNGGKVYYGGRDSENSDTSGLGIKWVEVN